MGKGNFAVAQSGGPTAAINATLLGVIEGAMESGCTIFGAVNGIRGVIDNNFMNLNESLIVFPGSCGIMVQQKTERIKS